MKQGALILSSNVQKGIYPKRVEELLKIIEKTIGNGIPNTSVSPENSLPDFWCFQELTPTLIDEINYLMTDISYKLFCEQAEGVGLLVNTEIYTVIDTYFVSPDYLSADYFKNEKNQKGYRVALLQPKGEDIYKYYIVTSYHGPHELNINLRKEFDKTLFDSIEEFITKHKVERDEVCCIIAGDGNHLYRKELPSLRELVKTYGYTHVNQEIGRTFIYNKMKIQPVRILLYTLRLKFIKHLFKRINLHLDTVFIRDSKNIFNYKSEKIYPSISDHYTVLTYLGM
jgi:hypothetical protein